MNGLFSIEPLSVGSEKAGFYQRVSQPFVFVPTGDSDGKVNVFGSAFDGRVVYKMKNQVARGRADNYRLKLQH